jgi:hypothetical protein
MRKRLMSPILHDRLPFDGDGLDLANLGTVEITSEDEAYPIECALQEGETRLARCRGWTSDYPTSVRPATKAQTCRAGFQGS